jgi:hypothetical protein
MGYRTPRSPSTRPRPTPPTPADDDLDRLREAVTEAAGLLPVLAALLPEPSGTGPATGTIGRHAPESSEPWQAEAAGAYWAIWFGARKLADELRRTAGVPIREWGYGDTPRAMTLIVNLASTVPPGTLAETRRVVEGWVAQAQRIRDIDEAETWAPLPRLPGVPPFVCPYCKTPSLRMNRARLEVRCLMPGCTDLDGNPTRARMRPGRLAEDGALVFDDDTVVAYRDTHDEPRP